MTMQNTGGGGTNGFQDLVTRFWSFDQLIGSALIKIIYYIGLFAILIFTVVAMFGGGLLGAVMGNNGGGSLLLFIRAPIIGIIQLVFWRFVCELWLLMFLIFDRMGEIRDRLPSS